MEQCTFTQQDGQVLEKIKAVLEEMKFNIDDFFCDQSRAGYRATFDSGESPLKALITYDPKEGAILVQISFKGKVPLDKLPEAYAHLNEANSKMILGHFTLCRDCGELSLTSGVFITTQDLFKERFQANLEHILQEAYGGNSFLSESLSSPTQKIQKEDEKV